MEDFRKISTPVTKKGQKRQSKPKTPYNQNKNS